MVLQIILADILFIARIFPRPCGARKNTTQLVKYPPVLSVKPSNKVYILTSQKWAKQAENRDTQQYLLRLPLRGGGGGGKLNYKMLQNGCYRRLLTIIPWAP